MPSTDLRSRFVSEYAGDIKDPILTILLDTVDAFQHAVQDELLLSTYARRSDQIGDGMFEVLRRHLFGQMFPGPAFVVAQASLRDAATARPLLLEQHHYLALQDAEGNKVLFAPQLPCWTVPAKNNDVRVNVVGNDLMLGFSVTAESLVAPPEAVASVYCGEIDPLLVERLRCRIALATQQGEAVRLAPAAPLPSTVLRRWLPGSFTLVDEYFTTPYRSRFLAVPLALLARAARDETAWIPFPGLARYAQELERKLVLNAFTAWNLVETETLGIRVDPSRYRLPLTGAASQETIITTVTDLSTDGQAEYLDAGAVADPGYPCQYSAAVDPSRSEIVLSLSPPPSGEVKVRYCQYDLSDRSSTIAAGRTFGLYQGIEEKVRSSQSITPTHRLDLAADKERIWNSFRSLLASRSRWVSRDDLRAAIASFPGFVSRRPVVRAEGIQFEERVGRLRGFLTPFTLIRVPVRESSLLQSPDRAHFEQELTAYLKGRTVAGSFVRVELVQADAA